VSASIPGVLLTLHRPLCNKSQLQGSKNPWICLSTAIYYLDSIIRDTGSDRMRFLKDFLFTDSYLIKGHIKTGEQRLSTFLNNTRRRFLEMEEPTLIGHDGLERVRTEFAMIRINEILLAYEMEDTGDEGMRTLGGQHTAELQIHVYLDSSQPLELSGKVRERALESEVHRAHDFIVVMSPVLKGFPEKLPPEFSFFSNAPYLIVNRDRVTLIHS
jgi:hypothetical protein